jgi:hypothetical protein
MTKIKPIPHRPYKITKEEFIIQWVLARASFRDDFSGTAAARTAAEVWDTIQRIK